MEVVYTKRAAKDRNFWLKSGNKTIQKRITSLLEAIIANPYQGIGKPEALRENLSGYWSRRITQEHRLVYGVNEKENRIVVVSMRFHY